MRLIRINAGERNRLESIIGKMVVADGLVAEGLSASDWPSQEGRATSHCGLSDLPAEVLRPAYGG